MKYRNCRVMHLWTVIGRDIIIQRVNGKQQKPAFLFIILVRRVDIFILCKLTTNQLLGSNSRHQVTMWQMTPILSPFVSTQITNWLTLYYTRRRQTNNGPKTETLEYRETNNNQREETKNFSKKKQRILSAHASTEQPTPTTRTNSSSELKTEGRLTTEEKRRILKIRIEFNNEIEKEHSRQNVMRKRRPKL